jgi:hypothetical protein
MRLVADRRREVNHGVGAAQRLALKVAIADAAEIAKRDLDVDAMTAESPWITHKGPNVVAGVQQEGQKRPADGPARPGEEDHGAGLYPPFEALYAGLASTNRHFRKSRPARQLA